MRHSHHAWERSKLLLGRKREYKSEAMSRVVDPLARWDATQIPRLVHRVKRVCGGLSRPFRCYLGTLWPRSNTFSSDVLSGPTIETPLGVNERNQVFSILSVIRMFRQR